MEFAAALAGLVGLAFEVTKTLQEYCSDVRSSSTDVQRLASEVVAVSTVLKQLEQLLHENEQGKGFDQTQSVLGFTIKDCSTTMSELKTRLGLTYGSKLGKLTWPLQKERVQYLVDTLRRYQQTFQFSLPVERWWVMQLLGLINTD